MSAQTQKTPLFVCCAKNKKKIQVVSQQTIETKIEPRRFDQYFANNQTEKEKQNFLQYDSKHNVYCDSSQRITTHYKLLELIILDDKPTKKEHYDLLKYSCPICFKFYNYILQCNLCQQYICHLCCIDYVRQPKNSDCHYCRAQQNQYYDVELNEQVKFYSDSQAKGFGLSSLKSPQKFIQSQKNSEENKIEEE